MSHRVKASPMTYEEQNPMKQASTPWRHREIVEQIGKVLSNRETARKEKAARLAEIIRAHRDYRWVEFTGWPGRAMRRQPILVFPSSGDCAERLYAPEKW